MQWQFWIIQTLNSVAFGGLLFLLSSGFSLIFGLMRIPNLAHGAFFMLGAYFGFTLLQLKLQFWLAALAGGLGVGLIGIVMERFVLRRLAGNEQGQVLVTLGISFIIADICLPGRIRFRELIDPRYLKKHGLTDRDIAYEILDHQGLNNYHVADDLRTILFQVDSKGGGKELISVRWVVYEGHLYISPEKAPDPKTGIFKPWILRTKVN